MNSHFFKIAVATLLASTLGCDRNTSAKSTNQQSASNTTTNTTTNMQPSISRVVKIDKPNEKGYAKIGIRDGDIYQEGIVDANGNEVVQASSRMLVDDITDSLALVRFERKSLFVPLEDGYISSEDIESTDGFQYAEPFRCGLAMVMVNDVWFYLDTNFEKAFALDYNFAESFHHDRAYVKVGDRHRIIDTQGNTVAELDYD